MRICKESVTMSTVITSIDPHSPAEKAGIVVGEQLLEINGHHIVDVLDYRFYGYDPVAVLLFLVGCKAEKPFQIGRAHV